MNIFKLSFICFMTVVSGCATTGVEQSIWQKKKLNLNLAQTNENIVNGLVNCFEISGRTLENQDGINNFDYKVELKTVVGKVPLHIVGQKFSETMTDLMVGFKSTTPESETYVQWLYRTAEKTNKKVVCVP